MANPFASLFGGSPNTSGQPANAAPSGGAGIAAPAPQNVQPAPVPGQNPISGLLTSDAPGIFGLLGRAAGNPTSAEMMYRRLGQQQAQGLQGLTERLAKGMPQQQAILDFMNNDPRAMEFFGSSADPVGAMRGALSTLAPPVHTGVVGQSVYDTYTGKIIDSAPANLGPGDQRLDGQGNVIAQNLPADVQSVQAFQKAAGMSNSEVEQLSKAMLQFKSTNDITTKNDALDRLQKTGVIDPTMKSKIQAGVVQVNPFYDASGNQLGLTYTDLTDMLSSGDPNKIHTTVMGVNNNNPIRQTMGGNKTDEYGVPLGIHPSPDIVLAAGLLGKAADSATPWLSLIDPSNRSPDFYNNAHDQMEGVVSSLGDLLQMGNGRYQGPYNELKAMVDEHGWSGSPIQQAIAFRNLVQMAKRDIKINNATLDDMSGHSTKGAKEAAGIENRKLQSILGSLPEEGPLNQMVERLHQGEGSIPDMAASAAKSVGGSVDRIVNNVKQAGSQLQNAAQSATQAATVAPASSGETGRPSFQTEAEAAKAGLADGSKIIVNGRNAIWHQPKGKK